MKHNIGDLVLFGEKVPLIGTIVEKHIGDVFGDGTITSFYRVEWSDGNILSYVEFTVNELKENLKRFMNPGIIDET